MKVRITLPEMQKALARVKPREGVTFVELEGVEPSDPYFADFKQLNSFANCLLHKLTAQSQCQRALLLLFIGFKVKHFQLHNQTKMRFF